MTAAEAWWLPTPEEFSILLLSMRVALVSVLLSIVPGVALAWVLARRSFHGKALVELLTYLPLVLPPVVVGYLLLLLLGRRGVIGRAVHDHLGFDIAFTWKAAAIAAAVMGFPLLVRTTRLAIESVDPTLEHAARSLGASPLSVFFRVTLPLARQGLVAGVVLAFARSLGEFGATITVAGNIPGSTRTLPVAIYTLSQVPGGDAAAARLIIISIVLALAALVVSERLARRLRGRAGML